MVDEANLKQERIEALREYIRLLEKVQKRIWAVGMSPAEQIVLDTLERRVSWLAQTGAVLAGLLLFAISLWLGRLVARGPVLLIGVFLGAAALGLAAAILIYRGARARIARQEMRVAQLEIYRLEDQGK
jgi:hypothetical protein